ncbi:MAG: hypothetical protein F6K23_06465 [Okeania sp. SIO2C9]|uniref:hypothetical protein n=1 Tax=Okeania sp. SIO2C9 TaxID=2607791 RepID=UPI0013C266DE|nr:hypothetical protein [Okeania sp. SIO2C9]NEQ72746.1 hypothetical protein [Okeania sp. SIO2C9]
MVTDQPESRQSRWWCIVMVESVWGVREMGRWGDGEMGRWGDGEMGGWGVREKLKKIYLHHYHAGLPQSLNSS